MADINGGGLSFVSQMDNSQLDAAIDETLRRVQGLSDGMVSVGDSVDATVAQISTTLGQIGAACEEHENAIVSLENEYQALGVAAQKALLSGATDQSQEIQTIRERQAEITGEITVRKKLLNELRDQSNELENVRTKLEDEAKAADNNAKSQGSLRQRMRELKMELVEMEAAGQRNTERYKEVQQEVAKLTDAWSDAQAQATILANDDAGFAGVLQGLTGLTGAFSAAAGMVGLFGDENKDLQETMLKVQSIMAITNGLMQVSQTLNKDSAFMLSTVGGLKEWWNNLLVVGAGAQATDTAATEAATIAEGEHAAATTADTAATQANTAAQTANATAKGGVATADAAATTSKVADTAATTGQAVAAKTGTVANIGLAGAFRMVGAAIKSIPVFGWVIAGITALIGLYKVFSSRANEAKKANKEFMDNVAESAYKPIGVIQELSGKWNELGDNLEAKKKFIVENKEKFDQLGVAVNGVTDAENILVANKDNFINAQIAKAKALAFANLAAEKYRDYLKKLNERDQESQTQVKLGLTGWYSPWEKKNEEAKKLLDESNQLFEQARNAETENFNLLNDAGIEGTKTYAEGSLGAIEQAISLKQQALKNLTNNEEYANALKEIEDLQKQADKITGKTTTSGGGGGGKSTTSSKDSFAEQLDKRKSEYQRFLKWVNSGDETLVKSAKQEFAGLLEQGATYIDYLKNQRDQILEVDVAKRTKEQNKQLRQLNDAIAEETKRTVLESFNEELSTQLANANSIIEMLNIIEKRRKELTNDGTELDKGQAKILDDAEKETRDKAKQELADLLSNIQTASQRSDAVKVKQMQNLELLTKAAKEATDEESRNRYQKAVETYKMLYALGLDNIQDYESINEDSIKRFGTYEQRRVQIVKDYEQQIKAARVAGYEDVAKKIEGERDLEILKETTAYTQLFSDVSEIGIKTAKAAQSSILTVLKNLLTQGKITAEQYSDLLDKINEQVKKLTNGKEWQAIMGENAGGGIMDFVFGDGDFETKITNLQNLFSKSNSQMTEMSQSSGEVAENIGDAAECAEGAAGGAASAIGMVDAIIKAVYQTLRAVADTLSVIAEYQESIGNSDSADTLQDWADCINSVNDTAMSGWENLKSGNVMGAISDTISMPFKLMTTLNKIHDKKIEKAITKHRQEVTKLENAYNQLSWAIDNALGTEVYKNQQAAISNMEQQKELLQQMWEAEESKKNSDSDKIEEYKEQYAELTRQIEDMYSDISEDILQTNATDFAGTLGDALVEAFKNGEDAATAFEETVNEVLQNAVVNQLKKKFLEQQLQSALDNLENSMGYWDGDDFIFDGLSDSEIAAFKAKVQAAANNYNQALEVYKDLFADLSDEDSDDSLTGAVKGVSEETASIVAGQMNAIRINQIEMKDVLRQQLLVLNTIATNTSYNKYLAKIDNIISILESSGESLRGQGLV